MKNRINQIAILGLLSFLVGCGDGTSSNSNGSLTDIKGGVVIPTTSGNGTIRLRCEKRSNRSKVSVEAEHVAAGNYTASVTSNGVTVAAGSQSTTGIEVEFEFDSENDGVDDNDHDDIDEIARQDKAGNPTHIVDLHGYRALALFELRGE